MTSQSPFIMVRSMLGKVLQTMLVLAIVSVAAFWFLKMAPGDPVTMLLGSEYSPAAHARLTHELGLDQPVYLQYFHWLGRFVQGDWGLSYVTRDDIFKQAVYQALPVTVALAAFAFVLALAIGVPAGMLAALKRGGLLDHRRLRLPRHGDPRAGGALFLFRLLRRVPEKLCRGRCGCRGKCRHTRADNLGYRQARRHRLVRA